MNKDELKRRYFEKGVTALKSVVPIDHDYYCCPICIKLFPSKAIEDGILTIEHAPPEKVGGKPLALTCKDCNSVAGYSVDSAVVHRERLFDAIKAIRGKARNYKGRATLSMGGLAMNVKLEVDNKRNVSIQPQKYLNDPNTLTAFKNYMMNLHDSGKGDGEEFSITPLMRYHNKHSKIGDLKSAFIISFALFGYTYILHKRLSLVREQILNYGSDIIQKYWVVSDPKLERKYSICLLKEPVPAVAVKIDKVTIILPWLEGPKDFYQYLKESSESDKSLSFHGVFLEWPSTLEMNMDFRA